MAHHEEPDRLIVCLADLEENHVLDLVRRRLAGGYDPFRILEACREGVRLVGQRYEDGEYFITGLIMAGEILKAVVELIRPDLEVCFQGRRLGNMVIGTIRGDIHDIGKNLTAMLLSCEGFNVIDLGVDVPPETFAAAVEEHRPRILGLSCLLTSVFDDLKETVCIIEQRGLRSGLSIVIGGAMVNETVRRFTGADHWTTDAVQGVQWCRRLLAAPGA